MNQTNEGRSNMRVAVEHQREQLEAATRGEGMYADLTPAAAIAAMEKSVAAAIAAEEAEKSEKSEKSDPLNDELQAMRSVARTLEKLPYEARRRVTNWLLSRSNEGVNQGLMPAGQLAKSWP